MKQLGYLLLAAGFLGGAFATSLDVEDVHWASFSIAAIAALIGLIMVKQQASAMARSASVLDLNRNELTESIRNIVRDLDGLNETAKKQGSDLRDKIDLELRNDLRRFADARESMVHLFGLQTYADIMSAFATGERYINRVWSASADGYDEEATVYLKRAAAQFIEAEAQLTRATQGVRSS